ncbi:MAG: hypothetical protein L6420_12195 [Elusimicrobia bacterium]|nr:hypothetical protein [Elusimicrobiota bacterium]
MRLFPITLFLFFSCALPLKAAWWAENDYTWGSQGFKKESLSFFKTVSSGAVIGLNAGFFKNDGIYNDETYVLKMPLLYSSRNYFLSFKPFYYLENSDIGSNAYGGKIYFMYHFGEKPSSFSDDDDYTHLILSVSAARQQTIVLRNSLSKKVNFKEASFEAQVEKNFYNQFFLLASGALFRSFNGIKQTELQNPALDHSELSFMGTFASITDLPKHILNIQFARNLAPKEHSHLYFGLSRINMDNSPNAYSAIAGMRTKINPKTSFDLAYNWLKFDNISTRNYYKLLFQIFF